MEVIVSSGIQEQWKSPWLVGLPFVHVGTRGKAPDSHSPGCHLEDSKSVSHGFLKAHKAIYKIEASGCCLGYTKADIRMF